MRMHKSRGDGRCLFHSVAYQSDFSADELLKACVHFIRDQGANNFNGLKLADWIFIETGFSINEYCSKLTIDIWPGEIELMIMSKFLQRDFIVYSKSSGKTISIISKLINSEVCTIRPVLLLYGRNHYDSLF